MPIEIRELVIKARVDPDRTVSPSHRGGGDNKKDCGCGSGFGPDELARILVDREER
ncbi:DUF5908 family protein [Marimonas arenosa]|uniref:DUF5908 family protein n=1 Tax=Marimonas arenosa TaxID=1795305 RepID=A0AAE4B3U2_9RHOB|nr:DUF5908 family protein [Marimonas arenosa]MDQ2088744.1 DUF5908 family protein [Marimonas arenosa]